MREYTVEIEGKYDLAQINLQISGEEAGGSEFLSSTISYHEGRVTNLAKFRELPAGTRPAQLTLIEHGGTQPQGTGLIWSGVMLVAGTNTVVSAYRAT